VRRPFVLWCCTASNNTARLACSYADALPVATRTMPTLCRPVLSMSTAHLIWMLYMVDSSNHADRIFIVLAKSKRTLYSSGLCQASFHTDTRLFTLLHI